MPRHIKGTVLVLALVAHPLFAENLVPESAPEKPVENPRSIMQRYSEVGGRINAIPEIADLKAKADEARRSYEEAFEAAMEKEDPELLKQYKVLRESRFRIARDPRHPKLKAQGQSANPYNQLSDEEKKQLDAARREAMQSAAVKEARHKRNQAKDEKERLEAVAAYREALHKAMIEVDEKVEDLLKKLEGKE